MDAILYIAHGSRIQESRQQAVSFIKKCMQNNPTPIQEFGFLELTAPTIDEAFQRCIERGAKKIKVIPVLLLTAAHAKEDIPVKLSKLKEKFPAIEVKYGRPIGVHKKMVDLLSERVFETNRIISADSLVVLVGRGSSDPDVKKDLGTLAILLKQKIGLNSVIDCYLTGVHPSLEEALQFAKRTPAKEIFIIPYLLFTGILMNSIQKKIHQISKNTDKSFILCKYIGYHPYIEMILQERILELNDKDFHKPGTAYT